MEASGLGSDLPVNGENDITMQVSESFQFVRARTNLQLRSDTKCMLLEMIACVGLILGGVFSVTNKLPRAMLGTGLGGLWVGGMVAYHGCYDDCEEIQFSGISKTRITFGVTTMLVGLISILAFLHFRHPDDYPLFPNTPTG